MQRKAWTVAAVLVAVFAGGLVLSGSLADEPRPRGQLYPNWKRLGLGEDQVTQIYKIQATYRSKIDKLEDEIKALKKQEKSEAEKVLTAAQRARLKEILSGDSEKPVPPKEKPTPPKDK